MSLRFNPPPNWPAPPAGWAPPPGWTPDLSWGPVPEGWQFWVEAGPATSPAANAMPATALPAMGGAEPPKQRSWFGRHRILTTLGAIVLVLIVINIAGGGGDDEPDTTADEVTAVESPEAPSEPSEPAAESPAEEAPPAAPGIGTPVRDGKFEFVVNSVTCGETTIGDEFLNTTAQGNFCFVAVTVTNIGDEAQSFWGDGQVLFNAEGQEYSADTEAAFYMEDNALYEEINPGNSLTGTIVYDVPVGTVPASIELHDSIFSGGVTVALL